MGQQAAAQRVPPAPPRPPLTSGCISARTAGTWNRSISSIMVAAGQGRAAAQGRGGAGRGRAVQGRGMAAGGAPGGCSRLLLAQAPAAAAARRSLIAAAVTQPRRFRVRRHAPPSSFAYS